MNDQNHEPQHQEPETPAPPTQEELYDDLRRIGQLEDQKKGIQSEIDERTERLRNAIPTLDPSSLLHELLSKTMTKPVAAKTAKKKAPRKKTTRKRK